MKSTQALPEFVKPMLAEQGQPFDSDEHLFEIKWDGIRAMAYIEDGTYHLRSRRRFDITERYPEFECLGQLPNGTVLDGEIVVLDENGKPDFHAVLSREQARNPRRYPTLSRATPAHFVVFDQLYDKFDPIVQLPLVERRQRLIDCVQSHTNDRLNISEGIIGPGVDFFKQAVQQDLEGVVAKRLHARYQPGVRSDAWIKFRKSSSVLCAIIGYVPKNGDFESLIIAADDGGELRCVGRVGNGFDAALREKLIRLLEQHVADAPLIPCKEKGRWLHAGLYCSIRYLEMTREGILREPVFERLINN